MLHLRNPAFLLSAVFAGLVYFNAFFLVACALFMACFCIEHFFKRGNGVPKDIEERLASVETRISFLNRR